MLHKPVHLCGGCIQAISSSIKVQAKKVITDQWPFTFFSSAIAEMLYLTLRAQNCHHQIFRQKRSA